MKTISTVLVRVLAISLFLSGLRTLISFCIIMRTQSDSMNYIYMITTVVYFIIAICLWKSAPWLSNRICRDCNTEISLQHLSIVDLYSVAFLAIGLFLFASSLGSALNWIGFMISEFSQSMKSTADDTRTFYSLFDLLTRCFLGLIFIIKGRSLSRRLLAMDNRNSIGKS